MNNSEFLQKIDFLSDQGNMVWENPGNKANQDIGRFCDAVKGLVHELYGADHPYLQRLQSLPLSDDFYSFPSFIVDAYNPYAFLTPLIPFA